MKKLFIICVGIVSSTFSAYSMDKRSSKSPRSSESPRGSNPIIPYEVQVVYAWLESSRKSSFYNARNSRSTESLESLKTDDSLNSAMDNDRNSVLVLPDDIDIMNIEEYQQIQNDMSQRVELEQFFTYVEPSGLYKRSSSTRQFVLEDIQ